MTLERRGVFISWPYGDGKLEKMDEQVGKVIGRILSHRMFLRLSYLKTKVEKCREKENPD